MGQVERTMGPRLVLIGAAIFIPISAGPRHECETSTFRANLRISGALDAVSAPRPASSIRFETGSTWLSQAGLGRSFAQLPLSFEPNQGQTDRRVKFLLRGGGYTLFLTGEEAVLAFEPGKSTSNNRSSRIKNEDAFRQPASSKAEPPPVLRMKLLGSSPTPQIVGLDKLPGRSNYFIGNDPQRWRTDIPHYARVGYRGVFPGVDLTYYGNQGRLEHDFVIAPGGDPKLIRLRFSGARKLEISGQGDLILKVKDGEISFHKPIVYQRTPENGGGKHFLDARYVVRGRREVGFGVTGYDRSKTLVIDPVLSYSTYLGGGGLDVGNGIAVDSTGSAYVTGETTSTNFPTTVGTYQATNLGASDVFVTKLDPTGSSLIYSTYIGGTLSERGSSIAVDSAGNAAVTGRTNSNFDSEHPFPLMNAYQTQLFGDFGAFVTELNAQGNALLFSTYLGGLGNAEGSSIAVDSFGDIYVTGGVQASGDGFPTTEGAFQRFFGGGPNDAFVTKFDPTQSGLGSLVYSTFLGGGDMDRGNSITVDSAGNAYVTGRTASMDFPTVSALQPGYGGGTYDAFVTELNSTGTALVYSTFLGGTGDDQGFGIAVDSAGNAYVAGETDSTDFSTTANAYQAGKAGSQNAFVAEISTGGSSLVYSTYLGGSGTDIASGIAVDTTGIAYITGRTSSTSDFPTTPDAIQPAFGGGPNDAFVAKIDPSQSGVASLVYSSYLGGSGDEDMPSLGPAGNPSGAIAVDAVGNAYVTGNTSSTADFPLVNSFQGTFGGGTCSGLPCPDAFVAKITFGVTSPDFVETATPDSQTIAAGSSTTYTVTVSPTGGFTGDVTLSVDGLPPGASVTFDPPVITITDSNPQSSTMTVMTDVATPLDTYPLTITGASDSLQHTTSVSLVITSSNLANPSITKTASPHPARTGAVPHRVNRRRERSDQRVR